MIKFLLDENVPSAVGQFLREKGFDVAETTQAIGPGSQDDAVMALARQHRRVLLTFDKHFSNISRILQAHMRESFGSAFILHISATSYLPFNSYWKNWTSRPLADP